MFMKVTNGILLKYFYLEKFSVINKNIKWFMLSGNVRSLYADSFDRKELLVDSLRSSSYFDIKFGFKNMHPKEYECKVDDAENVVKRAFEDAKTEILKELESIDSLNDYIRYSQTYNYGQICCVKSIGKILFR